MAMRNPTITQEQEEQLLHGNTAMFGIYQIPDGSRARDYRFMNLRFAVKHDFQFRRSDYELVYVGELSRGETLEILFERFNRRHPPGYTGHSLSVSDVVVLNEDGKATAYFVDSYSFQELPEFLLEQTTEKKAELSEEMAAYRIGDQYFAIQVTEEGYDYTFYDSGFREIDGGVIEAPDRPMNEVREELLEEQGIAGLERTAVDYEELSEKADALQQEIYRMVQEEYRKPETVKPEAAQSGAYLEFYAAQCEEFPDMGRYRRSTDLKEIAQSYVEYQEDPESRYMGSGLGIIYRDPEDAQKDRTKICIVAGEKIHGDRIASAAFLASSALVHEALEQIRKLFPEYSYIPLMTERESDRPPTGIRKVPAPPTEVQQPNTQLEATHGLLSSEEPGKRNPAAALPQAKPEQNRQLSVGAAKVKAVAGPQQKKSIHERLKENKEIIAKQQGKGSKEKGAERA